MRRTGLLSIAAILCLLLLSACQVIPSSGLVATGRQNTLTVWSFFPNSDMEVLVKNYEALHPETKVIHTGYAFSALAPAFRERASQGLGPDAVILTERELPSLIEAGLVSKLEGAIQSRDPSGL